MRRKATDREQYFPLQRFDDLPEVIPALSSEDRHKVHSTPVYLTNTSKVFDVEGFVPKESIIDTGASKPMCSLRFATAIGIEVPSLQQGDKYVTASGNVEKPLGVTRQKLKFTLGRGTTNMVIVELHVTIVDTTAYDMLLGMDFMRAFNEFYDSYTEPFTYRWHDAVVNMLTHSISAPCHTAAPPVVAYACFEGLISSPEELLDVRGSHDDIVPEDDNCGWHNSPF